MHVLRCKGLFRGKGPEDSTGPQVYMLQGVGDLFEFRRVEEPAKEGDCANRFLFVGRGIDAEMVTNELKTCIKTT